MTFPFSVRSPAKRSRRHPKNRSRLSPAGRSGRQIGLDDEPKLRLLAAWSDLHPRLRQILAHFVEGTELDVDRTVDRLSAGELLACFPRRRRRRWGTTFQVLMDRSERLVPFWQDQSQVIGELSRFLAPAPLEQAVVDESRSVPVIVTGEKAGASYEPPSGGMVLALSDLGSLSPEQGEARQAWLNLGEQLHGAGCRALALVPCPIWRVPADLRRTWQVLPWDRTTTSGATRDELRACADQLLRLVSPAIRIEPGFLRAVRTTFGERDGSETMAFDAGTEVDVWQHPTIASTHKDGATLDPEAAKVFRAAFAAEPIERQRRVLAILRVWRRDLPHEIWLEEVLSLSPISQAALPHRRDIDDARRFFDYVGKALEPSGPSSILPEQRAWYRRFDQRATAHAWEDPEVGPGLQRAAWSLFKNDPSYRPPPTFDPAASPGRDADERRFDVSLESNGLTVSASSGPGSLVGHIKSANGLLRVTPIDEPDSATNNAFWALGHPPSWATEWGIDECGSWVVFEIAWGDGETVHQKMRWIPPGSFLMGSPANEKGRFDDEDPRHEVTFARGFWLFETPCTQTLWQAVMGKNPSRFKGEDRPVEKVSWHDAKTFIDRLNELLPGLSLDLPSEAQWEYACRAGTTTAYSYGDKADADFMNFGESEIGETSPVHRYPANPWGLRDMHGNVWEWCLDHWHENYEGAPTGGSAWLEGEAPGSRVVRGGSWIDGARIARAASRPRIDPGVRGDSFGFRCARGQASDREAEPAGPASWRKAEPRHAQEPTGGAAAVIRLAEGEPRISHPLTDVPSILIRSDREELTLSRLTKPEWASAIGRDRFGLYARFSLKPDIKRGGIKTWLRRLGFLESAEIPSPQGQVTQTLRWIPPGRFVMGSPESEAGRFGWEGPQHEVTLEQGFWLFDTPCTQALWGAVMGENPSRFKSPDRPVEMVSWNDAQEFIDKLNDRIDGLGLSLPSEAQWEYACRGGTTTSSYAGEVEFLGENNAPLLDDIAWYSGNSGVDFDLEEGHDSSDWKEKQYPHEKAGTHPVGRKRPNAFGLHDMLGNVWEWCADPWHESYEGVPTDGSVWDDDEASGSRVVRGGSWFFVARHARAAFRYRFAPGGRDVGIGFRCARGQA